MKRWEGFRSSLKAREPLTEYKHCIEDLLTHDMVRMMNEFRHHHHTTCLAHSLHVSYMSYRFCKYWRLDYRSAARGALLHDLFLYDWRITDLEEGKHAFRHPGIALANARKVFDLNPIEQDIVVKHMWPLTVRPPRFRESMIVCMMDKYCTTLELGIRKRSPLPTGPQSILNECLT